MSETVSAALPRATNLAAELIAEVEGFYPSPHRNVGGVWIIGYGFIGCNVNEYTPSMSKEDAQRRLAALIQKIVLELVIEWNNLYAHEYAALASLIHNIGRGNFYVNSHFPKLLNRLNPINPYLDKLRSPIVSEIYHLFLRWCYIKGVENAELKARREKEAYLFIGKMV